MPTYEQNKKYAAKWDKEHMATVSCKIRKETRDQFKAWAESQGLTVSGALSAYVRQCIGEPVENSVASVLTETTSVGTETDVDGGA